MQHQPKENKRDSCGTIKTPTFHLWIHDLVSQEVRFHNFKDLYTCMLKS